MYYGYGYDTGNSPLDFIERDDPKHKLIIRQYSSNLMGEFIFDEIELASLEEIEYLRDNLNKFISKWKVKYAGYENTNN